MLIVPSSTHWHWIALLRGMRDMCHVNSASGYQESLQLGVSRTSRPQCKRDRFHTWILAKPQRPLPSPANELGAMQGRHAASLGRRHHLIRISENPQAPDRHQPAADGTIPDVHLCFIR